jgi:hypothetical protein
MRTDLTAVHYQADKALSDGKNWYSNFDATVSLGYTF